MSCTVGRFDWIDEAALAFWREAVRSGKAPRNTIVQTPEWNRIWWSIHGADPRRELFLLKIMEEGRICCIAPLMIQSPRFGSGRAWRKIMWLGTDHADYHELITEGRKFAALWQSIADFAFSALDAVWFELWDVLPDSSLNEFLETDHGYSVSQYGGRMYQRIVPPAEGEPDALLEPGFRKNLRRAEKLLGREGSLTWELVENPGAEWCEVLIRLNRERFGDDSVFREDRAVDFFRALVEDPYIAQRSSLAVLALNGDPVSILQGFTGAEGWEFHLAGSSQAVARFSPTGVNLLHLLRLASERKWKAIDFLRGDEAYKRRWGTLVAQSRTVDLFPRGERLRHRASRLWSSASGRGRR